MKFKEDYSDDYAPRKKKGNKHRHKKHRSDKPDKRDVILFEDENTSLARERDEDRFKEF